MFREHDIPLLLAYLIALGGWLIASSFLPKVWQRISKVEFVHPWREFGFALLGGIGTIVVGQLWIRGIRLPEQGTLGPIFEAINQIYIFAPILLVPLIRRQSFASAWLPRRAIGWRVLVGILLSILAVSMYSILREGSRPPWVMILQIWQYKELGPMAQVLLEDVTIAILFVRLAGAIGKGWAALIVACLFAAGHVPTMLSEGATLAELAGLLRDAGLGLCVILVLQRSRDIVWFWFIHFSLDMTQFTRVTGIG